MMGFNARGSIQHCPGYQTRQSLLLIDDCEDAAVDAESVTGRWEYCGLELDPESATLHQ